MRRYTLRPILLTAALALLVPQVYAAVLPDVRDIVKDTFKVRPGGTLHLDLDVGDVQVITATGSEVLVEVERIAQTNSQSDARAVFERHQISLQQRGNDVHVESEVEDNDSGWGRWKDKTRLKVRVYVRIPDQYNVEFSSGAGNIELTGVGGRVSGETGAGNVQLSSLRGNADISTGAGYIKVERAMGGRLDVSSGAGNIELKDIQGAVNASTGAGNISAHITRQPNAPSELESGAGNVTVLMDHRLRVNVDAHSGIGSVSTDFPLKVEGSFMSKSCEGPVNGGGPSLRMHTGVGNVSLRKI